MTELCRSCGAEKGTVKNEVFVCSQCGESFSGPPHAVRVTRVPTQVELCSEDCTTRFDATAFRIHSGRPYHGFAGSQLRRTG